MTIDEKRHCCILGGCGFLGSVAADHLLRAGWCVRVLDREGVDPWRIAPLRGNLELLRGDFMNKGDLRAALGGVNVVLHFVGTTIPQTSMQDIAYDINTNVVSTVRLLEQMHSLKIPRLVYASSGGTVYGPAEAEMPLREDHPTDPICAYGISKLMAEKYIRLFSHEQGMRPLILRFANPYGENQDPNRPQGAVSVFLDRAMTGRKISIWGDGSVVRDYIYQEDLGRAVAAIMEFQSAEGIYNVGSGRGHNLLEVLGTLETALGRRVEIERISGRPFDVPYNVLDCARLQMHTPWRPGTELTEGIRRMLAARNRGVLDDRGQPGVHGM